MCRTDSEARALALVAAGVGACLIPDSFEAPGVTLVEVQTVHLVRRLGIQWLPASPFAPLLAGL